MINHHHYSMQSYKQLKLSTLEQNIISYGIHVSETTLLGVLIIYRSSYVTGWKVYDYKLGA